MSTFQVKGTSGTIARVQTSAPKVFRVTTSARGPRGANGVGVPAGGSAGQKLIKLSGEDYATGWAYENILYYNVKDFGATGLGTGNDRQAIQNAIDQAYADGGGTVFFPAGNYRILTTLVLKARVNLVGISRWGSTITQATVGARAIEMVGGASNIDTGTVIRDLAVVGSGGGTTAGVYLEASALWYINMSNVTVTGFGGHAIHIRGSVVTSLSVVTGAASGGNGIYIDGSSSFVTSVSLISCFGLNNVLAGIKLEKSNYTSLVSCASDFNDLGYHIKDCLGLSMVGCGSEYAVTASYKIEGEVSYASHANSLEGCYAYNSKGIGFWFTGYVDATLISCVDTDPFAGSTFSLKIDANAKVNTISTTFANPVSKAGGAVYTRIADTDGTSWFNKVNVTAITDSNGKNVMVPQATTNAVNYWTLINAATGGSPILQADGSDTNVSAYIATKGTGAFRVTDGSGNLMLNIDGTNKTNYFGFVPSSTGNALQVQALGTDANISYNLVPKGTGRLQAGGVVVPTISSADTLTNKIIAAGANTITGLAVANFGGITGTPSSSTYLRGDGTWSAIAGGGDALTTNPLSQFASTTSLQLKGVISDETGSGALVFGTSPTLVTPALGTPSSVDLTNATNLPVAGITGTLPVGNGGTGLNTLTTGQFLAATSTTTFGLVAATGSGNVVRATSPVLVTPALGTPSAIVLTSGTGLPISTGLTGAGTGVLAALAAAVSGSGSITLTTSPVFVTPTLGAATATSVNKVTITAPTTSATLTLVTGSSLITAGAFALTLTTSATTNATLPAGTSTLYGTGTGTITSAQMLASLSDETGTGALVFGTSPTLTTPILGAATVTSLTASNAVQQLTFTQTGAPTATVAQALFINNTTTSNPTVYARSDTSFAYSNSLYTAEFVNASDTGRGFHVKNAGTGNSLQIDNGTTLLMRIASTGVIFPLQAITASAPAYVKGGIYFDTTLNKLRVGGATAWETITST